MNFSEFQRFRDEVLRERPEVLDCAATNLYAALARLIPPMTPPPDQTVHRCHLASEWTERFGISSEDAPRALISSGVRDSLQQLFSFYAQEKASLWLPSDNYPVYGELARAAGLVPKVFHTLPQPEWPDEAPTPGVELLVVTNPLKPLGRWLTARDVEALTEWLGKNSSRRLVLDAVYTFDTQFHSTTLQLLETGQTILLHSLTKGWLQPRLFGVALVPQTDADTLTPVFRQQPPPQSNLARARELMAEHAAMPSTVARQLMEARVRLLSTLPASLPAPIPTNAPGYLFPIKSYWSDLLEDTRVLGLPASVFGSPREDLTILSSLSFAS